MYFNICSFQCTVQYNTSGYNGGAQHLASSRTVSALHALPLPLRPLPLLYNFSMDDILLFLPKKAGSKRINDLSLMSTEQVENQHTSSATL